ERAPPGLRILRRDSPKTRRVSSSSRPLLGTARTRFSSSAMDTPRLLLEPFGPQRAAGSGDRRLGAQPVQQAIVLAARGKDVALLAGHLEDNAGIVVEARREARIERHGGFR